MRIHLASESDVAVCIKPVDEFITLVAQVGLSREYERCWHEGIVDSGMLCIVKGTAWT